MLLLPLLILLRSTTMAAELRALPDHPALSDRESLIRFSEDLQSPEYVQALLMALSGVTGAPAAQQAASRGILGQAVRAIRGTPEQLQQEAAEQAAYRAQHTPEEWAALMRHWQEYNTPASMKGYAPSQEALRAQDAPVRGILDALKFSLGLDAPKTAAMAR